MTHKFFAILISAFVVIVVSPTGRAQTARLTLETSSEDAILITSSNNHTWRIGPNSGTGVGFGFYDEMAGATRLGIDLNGNVGVGTTSPQTRLDVAGSIRSSSGGFVFPDGSMQMTAAVGGHAAGAGLSLNGNTLSIANGGVTSAMLADGSVTAEKLSADLVGGVQQVVRGVFVFDGSVRDMTQTLPQSINPAKSYAIVGPPVLSGSGSHPDYISATLIDLTATSISIAIGYYAVPCRVSYQVIQFK